MIFCVNMSTFKKCIAFMVIFFIFAIWMIGMIMGYWEWGIYEKYRWIRQN